jgi:3-methylcrotonyl-CoA carboxylase alpha subunit
VRTLRQADFVSGEVDTGFIERHADALITSACEPAPEIFARAALFLVEERKEKSPGRDPWSAQDGFRLSGEARETIDFAFDSRRVPVEIMYHRAGSASIRVAGAAVARAAHTSAMRLESGEIAVMQNGETWTLQLHDPFLGADAAGVAADRISSPMPGKIVQILVRAGEAVKQGQPLAVLEAMKMEHTLKAAGDARVESINVAAGEQVDEGAVILRFVREQSAAA